MIGFGSISPRINILNVGLTAVKPNTLLNINPNIVSFSRVKGNKLGGYDFEIVGGNFGYKLK